MTVKELKKQLDAYPEGAAVRKFMDVGVVKDIIMLHLSTDAKGNKEVIIT